MRVGLWFYGLATIATGILDVIWGAFEASHQPVPSLAQQIPGHQALPYIAGLWLIAAGVTILWRRTASLGAAGSALIYFIFALFWLPRFYTATHAFGLRIGVLIFVLGGAAAQVLLISPAAVVYAATDHPIRCGETEQLSALVGCWDCLQSPSASGT